MYYVAKWEFGKQSFVECTHGKPVIISGFEEFAFFIHHNLLWDNTFAKLNWKISEATTGMQCGGNDAKTQKESISKTIQILNRVGKSTFNDLIDKAIKSPYTVAEEIKPCA